MATVARPNATGGEPTFVLGTVDWRGYVAVNDAVVHRPSPRMIFTNETLTLVTKSRLHEWYSERLAAVVKALAGAWDWGGYHLEAVANCSGVAGSALGGGAGSRGTQVEMLMNRNLIELNYRTWSRLMQWGWEPREWDPFEDAADDPAFVDLKAEQRTAVCKELELGEEAVWAERACPPPQPVVRAFPAFFVSVLCGLSGFALSVVFGIQGLIRMSPEMTLYTIGLAPLVLGTFVVLGLCGRWGRYLRDRWRLSRTFYVLTDRRAMIGLEAAEEGEEIAFQSVRGSSIDDTLCIEKETDGVGDVCFLRHGSVVWPEVGFVGVSAARQVDELVQEVLLNTRPRYGFEA